MSTKNRLMDRFDDSRPAIMSVTSTNSRTALPPDALERALQVKQARMAENERRIHKALDDLSERYRSERVRLLGAGNDRLLREFAAAHRRTPNPDGSITRPTEEQQRAAKQATAAFVAKHGIDLSVLAPLNADMNRQFRRIVDGDLSSEVEVTELEAVAPSPAKNFTSFGSWDAGGSWWFSNSSNWVERFDSLHLPAWHRTGSDIRMHMWNTDDRDKFHGYRDNGYLVEYTMPSQGRLSIGFDATCALTERILDGDDEHGISDCEAAATGRGLFEVYSGWDDNTPDSQNYSWGLSGGTYIWNDDNIYDNPVAPGARRWAQVTTSTVFSAGATVLVYAATHQEVTANVNDTSVAAVINESWYVNSISVNRVN